MSAGPGVLLVGHDASRTGAPVVAAGLVAWAVRTGAAEVRVALLRGGPLAAELAAVAPTSVPAAPELAAARALGATAHLPRVRHAARAFARPPVVVANTVAAWEAAAGIERRRALVCWVHELDHVADALVPGERRARLVAATDRFLVVSDDVERMLVERWGVPASRVVVVAPFVDAPATAGGTAPLQVLGAGTLVPRKGPDLFVAVLAELVAAGTHLGPGAAAWVGGDPTSPTATLVRTDLERTGLGATVQLVGAVPSLDPWWPAAGLLVHPAREDPAPLVVLEAALRGVPVATWATGGAADLLREAGCAELVAPAGDVVGLADRVRALLGDARARTEAGRALAEVAAERTTEHGAPRALAEIVGVR